eukprot:CAMPEP_0170190952 /NCGR_PEP_ID=MMETSP0040_2-20121228/50527_1 /TAXON_ID=641309 /ORGANISM="Lotharella oceanica, Strain CCMP622" /LENGTH=315 /DNA_ID=CAMNT_0010438921 /DNA_START=50 /DNA_END=997 /DNA_ORIENTATION=+
MDVERGGGNDRADNKRNNRAKADEDGKPVEDFKEGEVLEGVVKGVTSFGAFLDVGATRDGLLHESRMGFPPPVLSEGDKISVEIISVDIRGNKLKLGIPGAKTAAEMREERENRTVCLGGLPDGVDPEDIKKKMSVFGPVEEVRTGGRLPDDVAYVRFSSEEDAKKSCDNPPSFNDEEEGALRECKMLKDHLQHRRKALLLVIDEKPRDLQRYEIKRAFESKHGLVKFIEFDATNDKTYIMFTRGSGARSAKEHKSMEVEGTELQIVETTDDHVKAYQNLRKAQEQRQGRKRRNGGGRGRGRGGRGGYKRRRGKY